jgi:hypothetical protein
MTDRKNSDSDPTLDVDSVFTKRDSDTHHRGIVGTRYGDLRATHVDSTGRRIACRCRCGRLVSVAIEDLESGAVTNCGCSRPSWKHQTQMRELAIERQRNIDFNIARAR